MNPSFEEDDFIETLRDPDFSPTLRNFASLIGQLKDSDVIMGLNTTTEHKYNLLVQLAIDLQDNFSQLHVPSINISASTSNREEALEELHQRFVTAIENLEAIIA